MYRASLFFWRMGHSKIDPTTGRRSVSGLFDQNRAGARRYDSFVEYTLGNGRANIVEYLRRSDFL